MKQQIPDIAEFEASIPKGVNPNGKTILVVEDDNYLRLQTAEMLAELGYRVLQAATAMEALRMLEADRSVRLLFTDVALPGRLNGPQLATQARRGRPDLKVLFGTGYSAAYMTENGWVEPGDELLDKPFTPARLADKIFAMLEDA